MQPSTKLSSKIASRNAPMLCYHITAAVQEKVDVELGIRVTTNQVETKLDTLKSRLKKYIELEKKIGWDDERYTVTAPLAAWEAPSGTASGESRTCNRDPEHA